MSTPLYFGRTWTVTVIPQSTVTQAKPDGEPWIVAGSGWATEALRVTFDTICRPFSEWWAADIVIYNPAPGAQQLIQAGDIVKLAAGYQEPASTHPLIFQGRVFQPLWDRVSATDYRLLLRCFVGKWEDDQSWVATAIPDSYTDEQAVRQVADEAGITVDYLDPALASGGTKGIRGTSFAGVARKFFDQVAAKHQMLCWIGWNGLVIRSMAPQGETPNLVYAPPLSPSSDTATLDGTTKYTLVGSPQQTEKGIAFRVLLDSDLQLGALVKLDFSVLRKVLLQPLQRPPLLDKDGVYVVASLRQVGDTRGQEWYTEVEAVTRGYAQVQAVIRK